MVGATPCTFDQMREYTPIKIYIFGTTIILLSSKEYKVVRNFMVKKSHGRKQCCFVIENSSNTAYT